MRSSGRIPITPLITDRCSVVSLSARISEGRFRPVLRHSGWLGSTATECADGAEADDVVMKAMTKSSGESLRANTRHGRRFEVVKSVNGKAAWTISPGWNMPRLLSKPRVFSSGQNIAVAVNLRLLLQKIEGATLFSQGGDKLAAHFVRVGFGRPQYEDGEPGMQWEMDIGWQFQGPIFFHFYFQRFHQRKGNWETLFAKNQLSFITSTF